MEHIQAEHGVGLGKPRYQQSSFSRILFVTDNGWAGKGGQDPGGGVSRSIILHNNRLPRPERLLHYSSNLSPMVKSRNDRGPG